MSNIVYIATSLDGYIADKNNQIDWLHSIPNPEGSDFGFADFMSDIDALVMGRNTFEMVVSFDCEWPYTKPVYVLSNTMKSVPEGYQEKAFLINGEIEDIVEQLNRRGLNRLYIDGGKTIQGFLKKDLIDELIITTIPIVLGGGIPLFADLVAPLQFKHLSSTRYVDSLVKNHFIRQK
ncbi:dihydrofolate reductase family protein [Vibrio kasasachensis]|uniref:dihydrofolate reductase family protein n=1 Tax=Vibrio kasasachensis TaxID=2910248 RepID=UPI003D09CA73